MKKLLLFVSAISMCSGLVIAQCANSGVQFGSGTAPGPGSTLTVTTCAYAGEYQVLSGVLAGNSFSVSNSGGASNYITIYNSSFTPIFWGPSPVTFTASSAGTYYSQVNLTGCGTDMACHTVVWTNTTPPPPCPSVTTPWLDNVETHAATTTLGISNCWTASAPTSFDWDITGTGTTPSFGTGANAANSGVKYFYTEASGAAVGAEAILVTPDIDLSGVSVPMLSFYYHMFGAQIGTLNVEISNNGGTIWNPVTSLVGPQQLSQADAFLLSQTTLTGYSGVVKLRFRAVSGGSFEGDICIDDIAVIAAPTCANPSVPVVTPSSSSICIGNSTNLTIAGSLNDATTWEIYDDVCGGTLLGSTATSSFSVSPAVTTTYFVRGVGACVTPGACGSVTVNVTPLDNATFNYSGAAYCANDSDPSPTISGLAGGTFSAGAGLSMNATTGAIDLSASTPGTYTVTYTTAGTCPNSSNTSVTINALDNPSFSYSGAAYCADDSDPSPTISGLAGGTFSAVAGLSMNATTGNIDLSASTPGTYTVTYTTVGTCPNSSSTSVTINALDDASFNYSGAAYCENDSDPSPTISGLAGGTFSSAAGLSIDAGTGTIDVSASTAGTYTVTYTTVGTCPNSASTSVTINALDDASFSYSEAAYCANASDPSPTISGLAGGTFSAAAGLSIDAGTGTIDLIASTPETHTVTYTTSGTCPNSSNQIVAINPVYFLTETDAICSGESYTFPDGTEQSNITSQVIYTSNLQTIGTLCDSIIVTTVNVNAVDVSITQAGTTLTANAGAADYQWLDCSASFAILPGETNQSFTASLNGSYAVEITENGCVDTSACTTISTIGIIENSFGHELIVYPNPTSKNFSIDLGTIYKNAHISITDLAGKLIESKNFIQSQILDLSMEQPAGIYLISILAGNESAIIRLVKN